MVLPHRKAGLLTVESRQPSTRNRQELHNRNFKGLAPRNGACPLSGGTLFRYRLYDTGIFGFGFALRRLLLTEDFCLTLHFTL